MGSFEALSNGVSKLLLTDPSVSTQREFSKALGQGLRCGFLGLLHMDVFCQRLSQEYVHPSRPSVSAAARVAAAGWLVVWLFVRSFVGWSCVWGCGGGRSMPGVELVTFLLDDYLLGGWLSIT